MVISKINFPIYGIIVILSVFIGMTYIYLSLKKNGYNDKNILLYFILYLAFAFIFGKLYTMFTNEKSLSFIEAGLSSYGGLIGVVFASIIFEKILPTDKQIIKYSVLSLPLVYGLSKIACAVVGCCYGIPYNGFLSVTYKSGLNIPLFPIQMLEVIVFLIIFILSHRLRNNKNIVYIVILLCTLLKFLLDFLRYDHVTKLITVNQAFSILLFTITIIIMIIGTKVKIALKTKLNNNPKILPI